jgi:hypothetical protein
MPAAINTNDQGDTGPPNGAAPVPGTETEADTVPGTDGPATVTALQVVGTVIRLSIKET